ncbi:MAG TPA: DUF6484 domain-containing protein [Steroidobacteraceae bacterium]|nr:DUF6484 domain-containing protein [Steroidobacteraceae bacterium]
MANANVLALLRDVPAALPAGQVVIGWVAEVSASGQARVDFPGNAAGPTLARSVVQVADEDWARTTQPPSVLLLLENGDPRRPIILGLVGDTLVVPRTEKETQPEPELVLDAKRLVFSGQEEIVIRCGDGSITLTRDGRIVLKGRELVSRATEANKIRGAVVAIN